MAMAGKKLNALELPEEDLPHPVEPAPRAATPRAPAPAPAPALADRSTPSSIPLPPIPAAPKRELMVQLSIKAPLLLVERLEAMTRATGAQKQAVMAAALDAYLQGHGY